jgi:hypothetical protein
MKNVVCSTSCQIFSPSIGYQKNLMTENRMARKISGVFSKSKGNLIAKINRIIL